MSWQKYIQNKGMNIGINSYGESATYKEVYNYFDLTEENNRFHSKKVKRII